MRETTLTEQNLLYRVVWPAGKRVRAFIHRVISHPYSAATVALLGALVLLGHVYGHAHGQQSVIDEGLYLYKGFLFATGRYIPFQDNGPWTNHMPLSFLIPGWVQQIFGLGLRTGRYYAIVITLLLAFGLWLVTRRLGGRWLAAGSVWFLGLNVALVKMYSQAISQGLVSLMLVWVMVLALGEGRRLWQLVLAAVLAGLTLLTRLNLVALLPLLILYIIWQNGWRAGLISAAAGILVVVVGHAFYWPDIIKIWAKWLPAALTPFLVSWRVSPLAEPIWDPPLTSGAQIFSLLTTLRQHLLSFLGVLFAWLSWPSFSPPWRANATEKMVYFLTVLFGVLFAMHAWASLANTYCIYCLRLYVTFFSLLGFLLFALTARRWFGSLSLIRRLGIILVLLVISLLLGTYDLTELGTALSETQLPRVSDLRIRPGTMALWVFLQNKFEISQRALVRDLEAWLLGFTILLSTILVALLSLRLFRPSHEAPSRALYASFVGLALLGILGQGIVLGNTYTSYDCGDDVIASYETAGAYLRTKIPDDALIYWIGGRSPVPLLYLPQARIFPPQLNGVYTLHQGGTPEELLRFGFWNEELSDRWLAEADYILVEKSFISGELGALFSPEDFDEVEPSPPALGCRPDSVIHIFRRTDQPS